MTKRILSKGFLTHFMEAFPTKPLPQGSIVDAPEYSDSAAVQDAFAGIMWNQLDSQLIAQHCTDLPLLTDNAFKYFLPAFLLAAYEEPDSTVAEFVVYALNPNNHNDRKTTRFRSFSPLQRSKIVSFLEAQTKHRMAQEAFRALDLWRNFS